MIWPTCDELLRTSHNIGIISTSSRDVNGNLTTMGDNFRLHGIEIK